MLEVYPQTTGLHERFVAPFFALIKMPVGPVRLLHLMTIFMHERNIGMFVQSTESSINRPEISRRFTINGV